MKKNTKIGTIKSLGNQWTTNLDFMPISTTDRTSNLIQFTSTKDKKRIFAIYFGTESLRPQACFFVGTSKFCVQADEDLNLDQYNNILVVLQMVDGLARLSLTINGQVVKKPAFLRGKIPSLEGNGHVDIFASNTNIDAADGRIKNFIILNIGNFFTFPKRNP